MSGITSSPVPPAAGQNEGTTDQEEAKEESRSTIPISRRHGSAADDWISRNHRPKLRGQASLLHQNRFRESQVEVRT